MKHSIFCLDRTGHSTRAEWDADTAEAGKRIFDELKAKGFTAFVMPDQPVEEGRRVDSFRPDTDVVFVPRLVGG